MFFLPFFLHRVIRFLISFFYSFVFSFISSGIDFSFFKTWDDEDTNGRERRRRRNTHKTCQFCAHNIFLGREKRVKKVLHFSSRGTWWVTFSKKEFSGRWRFTTRTFHLLQSLLHFSPDIYTHKTILFPGERKDYFIVDMDEMKEQRRDASYSTPVATDDIFFSQTQHVLRLSSWATRNKGPLSSSWILQFICFLSLVILFSEFALADTKKSRGMRLESK